MLQNATHLVVLRDQTATYPKLSPGLWHHVEPSALTSDGSSPADLFYDDFYNFGGFTAASGVLTAPGPTDTAASYTTGPSGYGVYGDVGASLTCRPVKGGVVRLATDGTDNDEVWLTSGGNTGTIGAITSGSSDKVIFEAKVKFSSITTASKFVGLGEEGLAAADTLSDAGDLASKDLIGFHVNEDDADALTFVYRKAGQALQTVLTYDTALAADTWYNLGFVFDPDADAAKRLKIYINNAEQTTYVTATQIAAATFPSGEELAVLVGHKNSSAAANTTDVDLVAVYAEN